MSKPKSSPAPRGDVVDQAAVVTEQLREQLREARGSLGDLLRERKATEKLARDRAEEAIETHVNACLRELTTHVDRIIVQYGESIQRYFQDLIDNFCNPAEHGLPDAPSVPEVLGAIDIITRAKAAGVMEVPGAAE